MIRITRHALIAISAGLLAGCGASPGERLDKGEQAFMQHRFQEAHVDFTSVLKDEPANIAAMDKLIRTYLAMENPVAVAGMLDRMAALGYLPEDAPVLYGEADLMMGRYDSALAHSAQSEIADAYRVRALAHVGRGETEKADAAFAEGTRKEGPKSRLYADYAHHRLGLGDLANARKLAAVAVDTKPVALSALLVSADLAMTDNDLKGALTWYDKTLNAYPESRAGLFGKIVVLAELGRLKQVRPLIKQARKADPKNSDFIYLEARLEAEEENWSKVRELLQPLERNLVDFPAANVLYARAMAGLGHTEQARVRLSSHLLRQPGNREVRLLLAETKLKVGDPLGAVETLQPVIEGEDATSEEIALMEQASKAAYGA